MDFRSLRYILTIMDEGNISAAARKLRISQPSLSQCLIMQEKKLGVPLFDRTKTPIVPTFAGEAFLSAARRILEIQGDFDKEIADILDKKRGRLVISTTKIRAAYFLPAILPAFKDKFPGVEIVLREGIGARTEEDLLSRKADVGILMLPVASDEIASTKIFDERILLVLPPSGRHPEGDKEWTPSLAPFREESFILYEEGFRVRALTDRLFAEAGFLPKTILETQTAEAIVNLVSAGMGAGFVPESVVWASGNRHRVRALAVGTPPLSSGYALAWKKGFFLNWAAREFMKHTFESLTSSHGEMP